MNEQQLQPAISTQPQQGDIANFLEESLNPSQSANINEDVDMGQNIEQQKINDFTEDKPDDDDENKNEEKMEIEEETPQNTNSNNTNTGNTYNTFNIYAGTNQQPVPPKVISNIGNKRPIQDIGKIEQPPQKERKIEEPPETKTQAPQQQQQVPPPSNMEVDIPEKSHMVEKVLKNPKTIPEVFQAARESIPNDDNETKDIRVGINDAMLKFNEQMEYNANNLDFTPRYQGDTTAEIKDQVPTSGTVTANFPSKLENELSADDSSPDRNLVSLLLQYHKENVKRIKEMQSLFNRNLFFAKVEMKPQNMNEVPNINWDRMLKGGKKLDIWKQIWHEQILQKNIDFLMGRNNFYWNNDNLKPYVFNKDPRYRYRIHLDQTPRDRLMRGENYIGVNVYENQRFIDPAFFDSLIELKKKQILGLQQKANEKRNNIGRTKKQPPPASTQELYAPEQNEPLQNPAPVNVQPKTNILPKIQNTKLPTEDFATNFDAYRQMENLTGQKEYGPLLPSVDWMNPSAQSLPNTSQLSSRNGPPPPMPPTGNAQFPLNPMNMSYANYRMQQPAKPPINPVEARQQTQPITLAQQQLQEEKDQMDIDEMFNDNEKEYQKNSIRDIVGDIPGLDKMEVDELQQLESRIVKDVNNSKLPNALAELRPAAEMVGKNEKEIEKVLQSKLGTDDFDIEKQKIFNDLLSNIKTQQIEPALAKMKQEMEYLHEDEATEMFNNLKKYDNLFNDSNLTGSQIVSSAKELLKEIEEVNKKVDLRKNKIEDLIPSQSEFLQKSKGLPEEQATTEAEDFLSRLKTDELPTQQKFVQKEIQEMNDAVLHNNDLQTKINKEVRYVNENKNKIPSEQAKNLTPDQQAFLEKMNKSTKLINNPEKFYEEMKQQFPNPKDLKSNLELQFDTITKTGNELRSLLAQEEKIKADQITNSVKQLEQELQNLEGDEFDATSFYGTVADAQQQKNMLEERKQKTQTAIRQMLEKEIAPKEQRLKELLEGKEQKSIRPDEETKPFLKQYNTGLENEINEIENENKTRGTKTTNERITNLFKILTKENMESLPFDLKPYAANTNEPKKQEEAFQKHILSLNDKDREDLYQTLRKTYQETENVSNDLKMQISKQISKIKANNRYGLTNEEQQVVSRQNVNQIWNPKILREYLNQLENIADSLPERNKRKDLQTDANEERAYKQNQDITKNQQFNSNLDFQKEKFKHEKDQAAENNKYRNTEQTNKNTEFKSNLDFQKERFKHEKDQATENNNYRNKEQSNKESQFNKQHTLAENKQKEDKEFRQTEFDYKKSQDKIAQFERRRQDFIRQGDTRKAQLLQEKIQKEKNTLENNRFKLQELESQENRKERQAAAKTSNEQFSTKQKFEERKYEEGKKQKVTEQQLAKTEKDLDRRQARVLQHMQGKQAENLEGIKAEREQREREQNTHKYRTVAQGYLKELQRLGKKNPTHGYIGSPEEGQQVIKELEDEIKRWKDSEVDKAKLRGLMTRHTKEGVDLTNFYSTRQIEEMTPAEVHEAGITLDTLVREHGKNLKEKQEVAKVNHELYGLQNELYKWSGNPKDVNPAAINKIQTTQDANLVKRNMETQIQNAKEQNIRYLDERNQLLNYIAKGRDAYDAEHLQRLPSLDKEFRKYGLPSIDAMKTQKGAIGNEEIKRQIENLKKVAEAEEQHMENYIQHSDSLEDFRTQNEALKRLIGDPSMIYSYLLHFGKNSNIPKEKIVEDANLLKNMAKDLWRTNASYTEKLKAEHTPTELQNIVSNAQMILDDYNIPNIDAKWEDIDASKRDNTNDRSKTKAERLAVSPAEAEMYLITLAIDLQEGKTKPENENIGKLYSALQGVGARVDVSELVGLPYEQKFRKLLESTPKFFIKDPAMLKDLIEHKENIEDTYQRSWQNQMASHRVSSGPPIELSNDYGVAKGHHERGKPVHSVDWLTANLKPVKPGKGAKDLYLLNNPRGSRSFAALKKENILKQANQQMRPPASYAMDKIKGNTSKVAPSFQQQNVSKNLQGLPKGPKTKQEKKKRHQMLRKGQKNKVKNKHRVARNLKKKGKKKLAKKVLKVKDRDLTEEEFDHENMKKLHRKKLKKAKKAKK